MVANIDDIEITTDMLDCVALALLYREDAITELRKVITQKLTNKEVEALYRKILKSPEFEARKQEAVELESITLVDDNLDTVLLQYNQMLKKAKQEGKYEVAARILKEIRMIKAIDNEQNEFKIEITVDGKDINEQS